MLQVATIIFLGGHLGGQWSLEVEHGGGYYSLALLRIRPLATSRLQTRVIDRGRGIVKVQVFSGKDRGLRQIFVCAIFEEGGVKIQWTRHRGSVLFHKFT